MKKFIPKIVLSMFLVLLRTFFITILFSGVLLAKTTTAQNKSIHQVIISLKLDEATIESAFEAIEQKTEFQFGYQDETILNSSNRLTLEVEQQSVAKVLKMIADETDLIFKQVNDMIMVKPRAKQSSRKVKASVERIITGKVTDEDGVPLAGVNVIIKDTSEGTVTDMDGNFRLSVPDGATDLIFSYVGYSREEVAIEGRSVIDLALTPDFTSLGEVVVNAGYWEVSERENTGNIEKISAEVIQQQPITNPISALQGRLPGVYIQQTTGVPGGGFNIQIRGQNSLRNNRVDNGNLPLYLIDGVPFSSTPLGSNLGFLTGFGNPLNSINPNDVESIEILKDADATAIYGSRGANGVVLITTKKGKAGQTRVDIDINRGVGEVTRMMDLLNTEQYLEMRNEAFANDGATPGPTDYDLNFDPNRYTDWQEELIGGTASFTNAQASVSGGNASTQFLVAGSYIRQTTVLPGDFAYQKGSGNFNIQHTGFDNRFRVSLSANYIADLNDLPDFDPTEIALTKPPNAPPLIDEDGNFTWEDPNLGFADSNPLARLKRKYEITNKNLITNMVLGYKILPGLELKSTFGYNNLQFTETRTRPGSSFNPVFGITGGNLNRVEGKGDTWIIEPQLEFNREIAKGELKILVGGTLQESISVREQIQGTGFQDENSLENPAAAANLRIIDYRNNTYRYNALFARINYRWQDKYIINLTGRRDGSSRFGRDNRFGNFGAVGAAWIFSNENFIQNALPFISFGKLRASYGTVGSDNIGDFEYLDSYRYNSSYLGIRTLQPTRLANPDFSWETNKKLEGGIELGFWEDRILFNTSYYRNRSSNQLVGFPLSDVTGFSSIQSNFPATVENTGWEFELTTININKSHFRWSTNINLTIPRNELVEFPDIENTAFDSQYEVGKSLFIVKALRFTGVDPETGVFTYEDFSEDGSITDFPNDFQAIKEIAPEYFGGIQNSFTYKGFQMDFLFRFVKQTGSNYINFFDAAGNYGNQPVKVMNRWQESGDITDVPIFTQSFEEAGLNYAVGNAGGDNRIVDASFIRLQNLSFSWHIPANWIQKINIQQGRIYIQGQNLLTVTGYDGLDPETFTFFQVPPLRIITGGVQITF